MTDQLFNLTEQLRDLNRLFLKHYYAAREEGKKEDFYEVIHPFAEKVSIIQREWCNLIKGWLRENPQKHIHLHQIEIISQHLEEQSVKAFFPETSRARLLNANRTVEYFLSEVLRLVEK